MTTSAGAPTSSPEITVVVALKAARTPDPLDGIVGWTQRQTLDRSRYRVFVAENGDHPELAQRVPKVLGPNDRLLSPTPRLGTFGLIQHGVELCTTPWIHICELHVVPEPDCLEQMLAYLATVGVDGATGRSTSAGRSSLAILEEQYYDDMWEIWTDSPAHEPLSLRGTTLSRSALEEIGGFDGSYGLFSGEVVAARLADAGRKLGFAQDSVFVHHDQESIRSHRFDVGFWTWGEIECHATNPPEFCVPHFGLPSEWAERHRFDRRISRRRAILVLRELCSSRSVVTITDIRAWGEVARGAADTALAGWAQILAARIRTARAELRFWLHRRSSPKRYQALRDIKTSHTRCVRIWSIKRRGASIRSVNDADIQLGISHDGLVGFHAAEHHQGVAFRWSTPHATIRWSPPMSPRSIAIELAPFRAVKPGDVVAYWDGRRVQTSVDAEASRITCQIDADGTGCHDFTIFSTEYGSPADSRRLGLPIVRVTASA